jgi:hypothetical protein
MRYRRRVEGSLAQSIWAAVMIPHRKAGHMTALRPATNFLPNTPLNLKGRPHMDGRHKAGHDDGAARR